MIIQLWGMLPFWPGVSLMGQLSNTSTSYVSSTRSLASLFHPRVIGIYLQYSGVSSAAKAIAPLPRPLSCHSILHMIYRQLLLHILPDLQFWAATLTAFFGLLCIDNITGPNSVLRSDIILTSQGIILTIRNSKPSNLVNVRIKLCWHISLTTTSAQWQPCSNSSPKLSIALRMPRCLLPVTMAGALPPSLQLPSGGSWGQSLRPAPSSHTAPNIPYAKGLQHGCYKPLFRWSLYVLLGTGPVMQFITICYLTLTLNLKWFLKPLTWPFH